MKKLLLTILLALGLTIGLTSPFWAATLSLSGATLDTSDFSAGVDNYLAARAHTFTGDHDAVTDGTISKDNCLMLAADNANNSHYIYIGKANNGMSDQADFKLTYSFYIPAGQNHVDGLFIKFTGDGDTTLATHTGITGAWTTNTVYWSSAEETTMTIAFFQLDGATATFIGDNDGTGDLLYLHNVVIEENTPLSFAGVWSDTELAIDECATSTITEQDDLDGWTNGATAFNTFASDTKGDEPTGTHSLHVVAADTGDHCTFTFTTVIGASYYVVTQYFVLNGDAGSNIRIGLANAAAGSAIAQETVTTFDAWDTSTIVFTATATTTYFRIMEYGADNDCEAYIDTISIRVQEAGLSFE